MPAPLLRRPAPVWYFHPLFLIFQSPAPLGEVIKITPPPSFKKRGRGPNYVMVKKFLKIEVSDLPKNKKKQMYQKKKQIYTF